MTEPKVNAPLIEKAKALRARGKTQEEIAGELGVVQGTISRILRQAQLGGRLIPMGKRR
jgi:transcriptional regulator with XRE-family HTH domain